MVRLLVIGKDPIRVLDGEDGGSGGGASGEGNRWRGVVGRKVGVFVALVRPLAGEGGGGGGGDVHVGEVVLKTTDPLIGWAIFRADMDWKEVG